jgi:hypothetical protein
MLSRLTRKRAKNKSAGLILKDKSASGYGGVTAMWWTFQVRLIGRIFAHPWLVFTAKSVH